jgi:hypothetical protein
LRAALLSTSLPSPHAPALPLEPHSSPPPRPAPTSWTPRSTPCPASPRSPTWARSWAAWRALISTPASTRACCSSSATTGRRRASVRPGGGGGLLARGGAGARGSPCRGGGHAAQGSPLGACDRRRRTRWAHRPVRRPPQASPPSTPLPPPTPHPQSTPPMSPTCATPAATSTCTRCPAASTPTSSSRWELHTRDAPLGASFACNSWLTAVRRLNAVPVAPDRPRARRLPTAPPRAPPPQAASLGLGDSWGKVQQAYAAANRALGDIVKVTPSSKVGGIFQLTPPPCGGGGGGGGGGWDGGGRPWEGFWPGSGCPVRMAIATNCEVHARPLRPPPFLIQVVGDLAQFMVQNDLDEKSLVGWQGGGGLLAAALRAHLQAAPRTRRHARPQPPLLPHPEPPDPYHPPTPRWRRPPSCRCPAASSSSCRDTSASRRLASPSPSAAGERGSPLNQIAPTWRHGGVLLPAHPLRPVPPTCPPPPAPPACSRASPRSRAAPARACRR